MTTATQIPLMSIKRQSDRLAPELRQAVLKVLDSGSFILGPEVRQFEAEFASALGSSHAVGVSNGTDALRLAPHDKTLRRFLAKTRAPASKKYRSSEKTP